MDKKRSTKSDHPDLSPDDIRRIRERLELTQVQAGELLGGGPRAFAKYESGAIRPAASVANLLRVLDEAPQGLKTLAGPRSVPVDAATRGPFEVSDDHVKALTPRKFVLLIERLLSAEAFSGDLPMDGIHVAAQITVGDGGEDARIEWRGGPERTAFLPSRLTQFQLKATSVRPTKAGRDVLTREGEVQPMIKGVLEAGGSYVMLVSHPVVKQSMAKHETAIRESLRTKRLSFKDEQISVRDASQIALWVNARPSVAVWLLEQTQPGLTGPFHSWSHWAGRYEHDSSPWVDDLRLDPLRSELRSLVGLPRGIARVVGPSGVGKSRLTLESLGPDTDEGASKLTLSSLVLYAVESDAGAPRVKSAVQNLADAGIRAIVVVDRCDFETHEDLAGMVRRVDSQLSLVTIDHEYDAHHPPPPGTFIIERAGKAVVEGIVHNILPSVEKGEGERLANFAAGFPQAARLIADSWAEGSLVAAGNDALISRVLLGRRAADKGGQLRKAGMLLGVFGLIGFKPPLDADIDHLAALAGAPVANDLRESFEDLARRGVAQTRGRLISLQPPPIAQPLAEQQWRSWSLETWDQVLAGLPSIDLRIRAAGQLSLLNREQFASDVVRAVCRLNGPFASVEQLSRKGAADVLSLLAEVDAKAVTTLLEHVLGPLSLDELREIMGDTRRGLVRALERIVFLEDTFEQGARLMLTLAAAENENFGNNATGLFKNLFSVLGGSTEAGPATRLQMLDELLSTEDGHLLPLVVDALLKGVETRGGYRVVGAEFHGSRPPLKPWMPTYRKDAWDYVRECLKRLARLAARSDSVGARAKAGVGREFRVLVSRGLLDEVEHVFATAVQSGSYWPEALSGLGDILAYNADALKGNEEKRVLALIAQLMPTDISSRVRFLVTEMPWNYPVDEKLEFSDRERRQVADVEALAVELLASPEELKRVLPTLSRGKHRMSSAFGRAIAQRADAPLAWLEPITAAYSEAPADNRSFGLLGGFLGGIAARHPQAVASFKQDAVKSATFAPTLPFVCSSVGLDASDIPLVIDAMNNGCLQPLFLNNWALGGVLESLPVAVLATLFDTLIAKGSEGYSTALNLIGMYVHRDRGRLEGLKPQLRAVAGRAGQQLRHSPSQMDEHYFKEMMEWILSKGRGDPDAAAIALLLARQVVPSDEEHSDDLVAPLLPQLLRDFPEIVWPILGEAIVRDRKTAWLMELALGDRFSFDDKRPAILQLPEEVLFAWCHAHPDAAPAFAARLLPVLTSRDPDDEARALHPKIRRLLDEFGDRENVLGALTGNIYTFGWSGSPVDYYALYDEPLEGLEKHPCGNVRRWAKNTRSELSAQIDKVRTEE